MPGSRTPPVRKNTFGPWPLSRKEGSMETTELIHYRRALKRKNYSTHTVKTYMNILDQFMRWLSLPLPEVTRNEIGAYVDHLLRKRRRPKTITCHLQTIRLFFDYLMHEEGRSMVNPVTRISLRVA